MEQQFSTIASAIHRAASTGDSMSSHWSLTQFMDSLYGFLGPAFIVAIAVIAVFLLWNRSLLPIFAHILLFFNRNASFSDPIEIDDTISNQRTRLTLEDRRDLAIKEIETLSMQRGLYELDPAFCIDFPSFLDSNAAHMISLSRTQKKTKRATDHIAFIPVDELTTDDVEMLEDAADDLSHALDAAIDTSKAIGWGKISTGEKTLLSRAQTLLAKALNEASTDNERMLSLRKLEDTIIEVRETYGYSINVEKIMLAVEEQTRMMIAA